MPKISRNLLTVLLIILPLLSYTQPQTETPMPASDLDSLLRDIENTMKREQMPGLMLSIVTRDSILYSGGLGYSDLENKIEANGSTLFHMNSVTKLFTALAIQKLISEGKLNLNDNLKAIAPEVPFENAWEATDPVKVVHLLEHTAGFDDIHLNKMFTREGKPHQNLDAVKAISKSLVSRWRPGERMSYCNPGFMVLGYLIEKFSGKPWNEYATQNVLMPLGMRQSFFNRNGEDHPAYAKGYYFSNDTFHQFNLAIPGGNGAAGTLVSNANDMSIFLKHLLNDWKKVEGGWLSEHDLKEMETVHSTLAAQHGLKTGFALGNELFPNNRKVTFRGHNGSGEGFNSWIFFNRDAGLGYSICNNANKGMWRISQLIENYLTKNLKEVIPSESSKSLDDFKPLCGYYQFTNPRSKMFRFYQKVFNGLTLSIDNNKLIVTPDMGEPYTLVHTEGNLFRTPDNIIPSFILARDKQGQPFFQGYMNGFYKRESYTPIFIQKALILAGILAMLLSVVVPFITIVLAVFKKVKAKDIVLTALPALAVLSLVIAFRKMVVTDEINKAAFSTINYTTLFIFLGSLCFGLLSVASVYLLLRRWSQIKNRWVKGLLAFNSIFIFYISCLLLYHGLIGIRIWSL